MAKNKAAAQSTAAQDAPIINRTPTAQDVQFLDNLIAKRADIRRSLMPEYFNMPEWWTPTVKRKADETRAEQVIRDWESWRKQYARTFRDKGLARIDGVLFFAAKITPGVYVSLIRAGKQAYCLEYARQFGTDDSSFKGLIGLDSAFPRVMAVIRAANEYHRMKRSKKSTAADIDSAHDAYAAAFRVAVDSLDSVVLPSDKAARESAAAAQSTAADQDSESAAQSTAAQSTAA